MYEKSPPRDLLPVKLDSIFQMTESLLIFDLMPRRHYVADPVQGGAPMRNRGSSFSIKAVTSPHLRACQIKLWIYFAVNHCPCNQFSLIDSEISRIVQLHEIHIGLSLIAKMLLIGASSPVSVVHTSGQVIPVVCNAELYIGHTNSPQGGFAYI